MYVRTSFGMHVYVHVCNACTSQRKYLSDMHISCRVLTYKYTKYNGYSFAVLHTCVYYLVYGLHAHNRLPEDVYDVLL